MSSEELTETIELIRNRIRSHRGYLSGHETRTRQLLIDPLLRSLGWSVEDPLMVQLEYLADRGWIDYVLVSGRWPLVVLEAKRLDASLNPHAVTQALNYASWTGATHIIVTNGNEWSLYSVSNLPYLDVRLIIEFAIADISVNTAEAKSLEMSRSVLVGKSYSPGR